MSCCRRANGISPKILASLTDKLRAIEKYYPGTSFAAILTTSGELVVSSNKQSAKQDELFRVIASLKRAAIQFASTLDQSDCPVMHIAGEKTLFSCYDITTQLPDAERFLLAFFTEFTDTPPSDFSGADEQMAGVVEDLRQLLRNLMI